MVCFTAAATRSAEWRRWPTATELPATGVTQLATADFGGSVWFLESKGSLWITGDASGTREISGQGATVLESADSGLSVYVLENTGLLYQGSDAVGNRRDGQGDDGFPRLTCLTCSTLSRAGVRSPPGS